VIVQIITGLISVPLSLGIIGGGIALLFRRSFGRHLVIFCPAGMALLTLITGIILAATVGFVFAGPVLGGSCCGIIIHLVVAYVFLKMQEDPALIAALR
jgi:hypothetical protein